MPFNGSGVFTILNSFVANTTILSAAVNANFSDIAGGLSDCLTRDGQAGMTQPLKAISGSAGVPSITFTADATTGLYLISSGSLGLTSNGTLALSLNAAQIGGFTQSSYARNFMIIDTADASTSSNINTLATAGTGAIQIGTSTNWATNGYLLADAELMSYTVSSANGLTINTRGDMGTTSVSHATGSTITSLFSAVSKSNWLMPARATASRATAPAPGNFAYNSGSGSPEYYNGSSWVGLAPNQLSPQGYLSTVAGQPILTGDSTSQTSIFYNPFQGNLLPVPVAGVFTVQTFSTATIALSASQTTANIYDIYAFTSTTTSPGLGLTFAISPSWSAGTSGSVTPGSCARGTGAGGTALTAINGLFTNTVTMSLLNGATTYSIATANGIYLGSIFVGATAGTVNLHTSYGQSRQWGVWNAYNKTRIQLIAGDATASWAGSGTSIRASDGDSNNNLTIFSGLAQSQAQIEFVQKIKVALNNSTNTGTIGIGVNVTNALSGLVGSVIATIGSGGAADTTAMGVAQHSLVPSLGVNTIQCLEQSAGANPTNTTYFGTSTNMRLKADWAG